MKKIYLMLLLVCSSIFAFADGLTATLQHGDSLTVYYNNTALQQAYAAAAKGDVITLSSGQFKSVTSVEKSIRIIGAYGLDADDSYGTFISEELTIGADNVKLEGMYFQSNVIIGEVSNCTIRRCYLSNMWKPIDNNTKHTNTLIDQCVIMYDYAIATGVNYCIKNSTINSFSAVNTDTNVANITNCYIQYTDTDIKAIYKNNVLRFNTTNNDISRTFEAPNELYYNYIYRTNSKNYSYTTSIYYGTGCVNVQNKISVLSSNSTYHYPDTTSFKTKGEDGTPVGMTGGEGFSKYPGIPRVLTSTIDAQTDDKGKLNATITVQAEK